MVITPFETETSPLETIEKKEQETALLEKDLRCLASAEKIDIPEFERDLADVVSALQNENEEIRPRDQEGRPGGVIELKKDIPTLVLHDIHGRREYILKALLMRDETGRSNLEKMMNDELQIVCLGDVLHAETENARLRWLQIREESRNNFSFDHGLRTEGQSSPAADAEIADSFGAAEMIMKLKKTSPKNFHYLRGNHDNIYDLSLQKFRPPLYLNRLFQQYLRTKFNPDFIDRYQNFESNLALVAVGENFCLSHAEPMEEFTRDQVINIKEYPNLTERITWTRDWSAQTMASETGNDATKKTLRNFLPAEKAEQAVWIGAHTPIEKKQKGFERGQSEKFIRFFDPPKIKVALIKPKSPFNPKTDIYDVSDIETGIAPIPESVIVEPIKKQEIATINFKEGQRVRVAIQEKTGNEQLEPDWQVVGQNPESRLFLVQHHENEKMFRWITEQNLSKWNQ